MRQQISLLSLSLFALAGAANSTGSGQEPEIAAVTPRAADIRPNVEVVFCLDTTSSMQGLIDNAKKKIWTIANQIASQKPTPHVRIGLVAFRDRGDDYITRIVPLSDDLDTIHEQLMGFKAAGGGDTPESVNQALHDAVTKIAWTKGALTYRIIFLVGDAPPHMNYADDVKYADTCKLAVNSDIIINTVQCGHSTPTQQIWQDISGLAKGEYFQLDAQGGPSVARTTPFDAELAKINSELTKTTLVFGTAKQQSSAMSLKESNMKLGDEKAAERAAFNAQVHAGGTAYDLLTNLRNGNVKLESLKQEELPVAMQSLNLAEQNAYLNKVEEQRKDLSAKAIELNTKRNEYLAKADAESRSVVAGAAASGGFAGKAAGGAAMGGKGGGAAGKGGKSGGGTFEGGVMDALKGQMKK